ncbi:uncharacterized protein LOC120670987 [Panicum virgatum]|uniref:uncharacterized protein LOC120670987 n=1 Tax=Panicum virgatum TaxID=38727 RepID=UPI0019D504FE|nr:uncharacterized protein LOC120670987 [Panicum virgatum]
MAVATRRRSGLVLPVLVAAAAAVLLLVAATGAEARPFGGGGDGWAATGAGPLPGGGVFIVETLRRLYLQQLGGPGASCQTNSPNNGCPP